MILPSYVSKQKLPHEKDIPRSNKIKFISNKPFLLWTFILYFAQIEVCYVFFDVLQTTLENWRIFYRDSLPISVLTFKKPFLWLKLMIILNRLLGSNIPWDNIKKITNLALLSIVWLWSNWREHSLFPF